MRWACFGRTARACGEHRYNAPNRPAIAHAARYLLWRRPRRRVALVLVAADCMRVAAEDYLSSADWLHCPGWHALVHTQAVAVPRKA